MAYVIAVFCYVVAGIITGILLWSIFFLTGLNRRFKEGEMFVILVLVFATIEIALSHNFQGSLFYFVYCSIFILGILSTPQLFIRFIVPHTSLSLERCEWLSD
jgi:hypothetical protein